MVHTNRFVAAIGILVGAIVHADEPLRKAVDFETDIRPILAGSCYSCHGPKLQKSDFRLDRKADALRGGDNGIAIVPGKSAESPLFQRVSGQDRKGRMPPKEHEPLSAKQVEMIKAWIDQGAKWPDYQIKADDKPHWAYQPLVRPQIPSGHGSNPIDAFVRAKLRAKNLSAAPPAEIRVWLRRVTFDLTGLPPTPEELRAFLADDSPAAFEKVVDRLLASPRYGERWARHWIDVSHFAESHGHDQDRPRMNAWPYRDYLIRSFNDDTPYARFVAEQIAGDVLFPNDPQAIAALGFLAAGPWDESSLRDIQPDTTDNRFAQVLDRDDILTNVMTTFVSATVNCARCHNHKFDPISQQDYYALQAVFAGVDKAEKAYDPDPQLMTKRRELQARLAAIEKGLPEAELLAASQLVAEWEKQTRGNTSMWRVLPPTFFSASKGSTAKPQADGSLLYDGKAPDSDTYWITTRIRGATAFQLEVMPDPSLHKNGPGRQDNGNLHLSEFRVFVWPGFGLPPVPWPIRRAVADFDQDGWTIAHALDGNTKTAWGIYPQVGKPHSAIFELAKPLASNRDIAVTFMLAQLHGGRHTIGRPRLSATSAANPSKARPLPNAIATILDVPVEKRTKTQQLELARFALKSQIEDQIAALPPQQLVYAATRDFKPDGNFKPMPKTRDVHVLRRGDINSPIEPAKPGTLACAPGLPSRFPLSNTEDEGARRAALANWIIDSNNVLTWRSIVNRIWHYHFGRGLVDTPNDFGKMGSTPSHPELLDWLACDFRDSGGSLKRLHRQIVLSETYRQSSRHNEAAAKIDGDNRYLWRMNRTRLDAESVRDAVLQITGKLDQTMGGPSVKQFIQSPGIHVTPVLDYAGFNVDDPANYRRSVYRFLFRTVPDPFMEVMDHPDLSQQTPVRSSSMTALQALTMLNNKFTVRQCEHLAARLQREESTIDGQIRRLYELTLHREPRASELELLREHATKFGLANVCRLIVNSNEFLFVP